MSVAAVGGNAAAVVFVVPRFPAMRRPSKLLAANLALVYILMALVCTPFSYSSLVTGEWTCGPVLCSGVHFSQAVAVLLVAYTILAGIILLVVQFSVPLIVVVTSPGG